MTAYVFDPDYFRELFPAFANVTTFPDSMLEMNWDTAGCIITNDNNSSWRFKGTCRERGLYLLTAHLVALSVIITGGQLPGVVLSATIDKITVTLMPPVVTSQFQQWLSITPYGQQLRALLQVSSVGGFYFGGLPELSSFRKVGGVF